MDEDIEQIRAIIEERNRRFASRGGGIELAGVEDGIVKIAPTGFCWR